MKLIFYNIAHFYTFLLCTQKLKLNRKICQDFALIVLEMNSESGGIAKNRSNQKQI